MFPNEAAFRPEKYVTKEMGLGGGRHIILLGTVESGGGGVLISWDLLDRS